MVMDEAYARPDVLQAETTMGYGADWYDPDYAEQCGDEAFFSVRVIVMVDEDGYEEEQQSVVAGPFPTEEEAWETAEHLCEFGE